MAKQRRASSARSTRTRSHPAKAAPSRERQARTSLPTRNAAAVQAPSVRGRTSHPAADPVPATPPRKPAYYDAIAAYESGVRALQKHDFAAAAEQFRLVLQRHPEERELVERATLYLRVCERETANRPAGPRTPRERIYAATVALNAGDARAALAQLRQALDDDPDDDHGHYIMAVALSDQGQDADALGFLRQAIALNEENRALARQDPDLAVLRATEDGRLLLESPVPPARRRPRIRR